MEESIERFRQILTELKTIKEEEKLYKLDDNILFDGAVRIYNSMLIGAQRTQGAAKKKDTQQNTPMTDKQRQLLQNLEYKGNMDISKGEASELIAKFLEKQRNTKEE